MKTLNFLTEKAEEQSRDFLVRDGGLKGWISRREKRRRQFRDMLGLDPLPKRTPLHAKTLGVVLRQGYRIERVVFQSFPGLYVRANLYLPEGSGPFPTILYLCGHAKGGKVHYQSWGPGFALRGFAALLVDTIEQNDGKGFHRGVQRWGNPGWIGRGYTPAGVEVWNAMRALDYLETRREVDAKRIGCTGLSGGGTMTWYLMAADKRVKAGSPACSTAHTPQHLRDWTLDTHCDCTFYNNFYRMSMEECYALCAPRPVLIAAQARDLHFLPWSYRYIKRKIAPVWKALGAPGDLRLVEDGGPHHYGPKLTEAIYRFFEKNLKNNEKRQDVKMKIRVPAPEEAKTLSCFGGRPPKDDRSSRIQNEFWKLSRKPAGKNLLRVLRERCFQAWPSKAGPLKPRLLSTFDDYSGESIDRIEIESEPGVCVQLEIRLPRNWAGKKKIPLIAMPAEIRQGGRGRDLLREFQGRAGLAFVETRGLGPWSYAESAEEFHQRAGLLAGFPLDVLRLWDLMRGFDFLRASYPPLRKRKIWLYGKGPDASLALLAALYRPEVHGVLTEEAPSSFARGPHIPGIERYTKLAELSAALSPRPLISSASGRTKRRLGLAW